MDRRTMLDRQLLGRMLNSSRWELTPEVVTMFSWVNAFAEDLGLDPTEHKTVVEIDQTFFRDGYIPVTAERSRLVFALLNIAKQPTPADYAKVAETLMRGAAVDGVLQKPWVQDAIKALNSLAPSSITIDDDSDD